MSIRPILFTATLGILTAAAVSLNAADLHVAPNGNDTWPCKLAAPNADGSDGPPATVGVDAEASSLAYIAEFIDYYFSTRCGVKPKVIEVSAALKKPGPKIIVCSTRTARQLGVALPSKPLEHDGFHLLSKRDAKGSVVVYCVGNNARGMKQAIYRLIHESSLSGKTLSLSHPLTITQVPRITNRASIHGGSWELGDKRANQKFVARYWDEEKAKAWVRLHDYFGFNAIEVGIQFDRTGSSVRHKKHLKFAIRSFDEQRRIGGKNLVFLWGAACWEGNSPKYRICRASEDGRDLLSEIYRYYAKHMAKRVDAFVTHWADPGGCEGTDCDCSVRTPQELHMEMLDIFRQYNPDVQSLFSLWDWLPTVAGVPREKRPSHLWCWKNTRGIEDVLDSGILADDVGIMVGDPNGFSEAFCRAIVEHNRTLGIWTWYLADNEIRLGLHVHWRQVADYFRNQAGKDYAKHIKWHQIEVNRHGDWNTINTMVAGAVMMDPSCNPEPYARAFCSGIFGQQNADTLLSVLDAIGQTRCLHHRAPGIGRFHDLAGWGSKDPNADIEIVKKALANLDKVTLEEGYVPKLPYAEFIFDPQVMLADLRKHLNIIILHNEAKLGLLSIITSEEFKSLPDDRRKARIKSLAKELAPNFDLDGIGICPEWYVWNVLMKGKGQLPQ